MLSMMTFNFIVWWLVAVLTVWRPQLPHFSLIYLLVVYHFSQ